MTAVVGVTSRVVRQVRPQSAARVAFAFGLSVAGILLVGIVALYLLALASGALRSVEVFVASFGLSEGGDYRLNLVTFLPGFVILSVVGSGALAGIATASAVLYNTLSELVGGVEIVTREREVP